MDGRRALVYSRIRHNLLNPRETDFDRARRQQQVIAATLDRMTSLGTALKLPFVGDELVTPLATDLGASDLMQLGWTYFRADQNKALHCRLGGDGATVGGESVILGSEDNVATVAMFTGRSAPQPTPARSPLRAGLPDRRAARVTRGRRYESDLDESEDFDSVVAAGFSVFPAPSLEEPPESPSLPPPLREPRP
jgi:hypothetical protein